MAKPENQQHANQTNTHESPESDSGWVLAVCILVVIVLALAYPVLNGAFLVNPQSEQYIAGYAFRDFATQSLRAGHGFPQWNSYMFGGLPYAAAQHGPVFYPTVLLQLVMRTDLAITWGFITHLLLAGLFMLGFLRALGLWRSPALFGAAAYMFSGPLISQAASGDDNRLFVSALLPLATWMLVRAIRDARLYAWGVFAFAVGLAALSANAQMLQYFLLTSGAFALYLVWHASHANAAATLNARIRPVLANAGATPDFHTEHSLARANSAYKTNFLATRAGIVVAAVLLGLSIGAIQIWPALGYLNVSSLSVTHSYETASRVSLPPEELLNLYLPQFSGILEHYWGRGQLKLYSVYSGIVALMFATFAFGGEVRRAHVRFWAIAGVIAVIWALGSFTPFFRIVYTIVPGTAFFRAPSAAMFVAAFSICLLGAFGVERVLTHEISARALTRRVSAWFVVGLLMLVLTVSNAFNTVAQAIVREFATMNRNDASYSTRMIDFNDKALLAGALRSIAVVFIVAALLYLFQKRRVRAQVFGLAVVTLCVIDLWSVTHAYWIFSKPASELFERDPIIAHLQKQSQPGRVFVYTKTADYRAATDPYFGTDGFGSGGGLLLNRVRSVTGYHDNPIARYLQLVNRGALIDPAFWKHENVRWLYTNAEIADTVLKKVTDTFTNSAGSRVVLYELPGENPYAWVASSFGTRNDTAATKELLGAAYDPHRFVSVNADAAINGVKVDPAPALFSVPSTIGTTVSNYAAGRATVQLSAPAQAGNMLVLSENFYNGWRATAAGKELPVMRASFNLVGVALPAGARTVSVSFQDDRYAAGRLVTFVALALTALLILTGWRRHRQTPAQSAGAYKMTRDGAA